MKNILITPLDLQEDLPQITGWDSKYKDDPKYKDIKDFIIEGSIHYSIAEVIDLNYEQYPIGNNERKYAFSIKNKENEVIGFVLCCLFNIQEKPELFIQYIVLDPDNQNKGYGQQVLNELLTNSETYMETQPVEAVAYINNKNYHSMGLFLKMGFGLKNMNADYFKAIKYMPKLNQEKEENDKT